MALFEHIFWLFGKGDDWKIRKKRNGVNSADVQQFARICASDGGFVNVEQNVPTGRVEQRPINSKKSHKEK